MISEIDFLKSERNYFTSTKMAIIRRMENTCWQTHTETGTLAGGDVKQCSHCRQQGKGGRQEGPSVTTEHSHSEITSLPS